MAKSICKDAVLDAAEAIVSESGAGHLTLDRVAERAGISKGGLMYSFPSKAALLQAMIGRLIDRTEQLREEIRASFGDEEPSDLMVEIRVLSRLDELGSRPAAAMMAAVANQPELMEPFREEMQRRFAKRIMPRQRLEESAVLYFAALGLHLSTLVHLPILDVRQRRELFEMLSQLAAEENAKR